MTLGFSLLGGQRRFKSYVVFPGIVGQAAPSPAEFGFADYFFSLPFDGVSYPGGVVFRTRPGLESSLPLTPLSGFFLPPQDRGFEAVNSGGFFRLWRATKDGALFGQVLGRPISYFTVNQDAPALYPIEISLGRHLPAAVCSGSIVASGGAFLEVAKGNPNHRVNEMSAIDSANAIFQRSRASRLAMFVEKLPNSYGEAGAYATLLRGNSSYGLPLVPVEDSVGWKAIETNPSRARLPGGWSVIEVGTFSGQQDTPCSSVITVATCFNSSLSFRAGLVSTNPYKSSAEKLFAFQFWGRQQGAVGARGLANFAGGLQFPFVPQSADATVIAIDERISASPWLLQKENQIFIGSIGEGLDLGYGYLLWSRVADYAATTPISFRTGVTAFPATEPTLWFPSGAFFRSGWQKSTPLSTMCFGVPNAVDKLLPRGQRTPQASPPVTPVGSTKVSVRSEDGTDNLVEFQPEQTISAYATCLETHASSLDSSETCDFAESIFTPASQASFLFRGKKITKATLTFSPIAPPGGDFTLFTGVKAQQGAPMSVRPKSDFALVDYCLVKSNRDPSPAVLSFVSPAFASPEPNAPPRHGTAIGFNGAGNSYLRNDGTQSLVVGGITYLSHKYTLWILTEAAASVRDSITVQAESPISEEAQKTHFLLQNACLPGNVIPGFSSAFGSYQPSLTSNITGNLFASWPTTAPLTGEYEVSPFSHGGIPAESGLMAYRGEGKFSASDSISTPVYIQKVTQAGVVRQSQRDLTSSYGPNWQQSYHEVCIDHSESRVERVEFGFEQNIDYQCEYAEIIVRFVVSVLEAGDPPSAPTTTPFGVAYQGEQASLDYVARQHGKDPRLSLGRLVDVAYHTDANKPSAALGVAIWARTVGKASHTWSTTPPEGCEWPLDLSGFNYPQGVRCGRADAGWIDGQSPPLLDEHNHLGLMGVFFFSASQTDALLAGQEVTITKWDDPDTSKRGSPKPVPYQPIKTENHASQGSYGDVNRGIATHYSVKVRLTVEG